VLLGGQGLVQVSAGAPGVPLAIKLKVVEVFGASVPFQATFRTVTAEPLTLNVPLQSWVMPWPLPRVHRTDQPLIAEVPAVSETSPWKPPARS
jgi:hypothetical protein